MLIKTPERVVQARFERTCLIADKVLINLATGLEDAERVTVAFLVAGAALERGNDVAIWCTKEAVRLALPGHAEVFVIGDLMSLDLRQVPEAGRESLRLQRGAGRRNPDAGVAR